MTRQGVTMRGLSVTKAIGLLCLMAVLVAPQVFAGQKPMYRGLIAGISTIDDTVRILGKPRSKVFAGNQLFCKYRQVDVKIEQQSKKILAIVIRDAAFRDVNGIVIGDPHAKVVSRVRGEPRGGVLVDAKQGIMYSFNQDGTVGSIIYAHQPSR